MVVRVGIPSARLRVGLKNDFGFLRWARELTLCGGIASWPATVLLSLVLIFTAGPRGHAQTITIAYDSFSYGTGSLAGQNGGTGWSSAWTNDYHSGVSFSTSATGMSYTGLSTSGGSVIWASGGNGISEDSRRLPSLVSSGVVYVQFLSQFGSTSGGGTPNLRLLDAGNLTGGFGGNGGPHGGVMSILDNTLTPAYDGSSSSSASLSALNLMVARIDYGADDTEMWMNPNLSTFDYQNPPAPDAEYVGLAPMFDSVAIVSRSPAEFDELLIMEVPEPPAALLSITGLAFGGCGWLLRRRAKARRTEQNPSSPTGKF